MRNPFSEYRNREQLTVNLRWRLTSCEIQYLEFALQNCTCKKTKQTKKTKSEKGKSKQKPKKKNQPKTKPNEQRNHRRHREETRTGRVLSDADGEETRQAPGSWKPWTHHPLENWDTTKESKTEPKGGQNEKGNRKAHDGLGAPRLPGTHTAKGLQESPLGVEPRGDRAANHCLHVEQDAHSCSWHQEEAGDRTLGSKNPPELQQLVPGSCSSVPASGRLLGGTYLSPRTGIGMCLAQTAPEWVSGPKNPSSAAASAGQGPGLKELLAAQGIL